MARRTKAEAEATRLSILDSAEQVFMDYGVGKTSLEQIARHAGVTRGAVYWHFRNKSDLLDAMLERVRDPLMEMIDNGGSAEQDLENLRSVCIYSLRKLTEDDHHFRVYSILFHRTESDQALRKHSELAREATAHLAEIFARPDNCKRLRSGVSPEQAARQVHTQMLGIFFDWLGDPAQWPLAEQAESLVNATFRGLLNPTPA